MKAPHIDPETPYRTRLHPRWMPREMVEPPLLDPAIKAGAVKARTALLINPFYPKDAHASFGKHVLTPTLALTSFAAVTPEHWTVEYWDENLLHGRAPFDPMPEVVGITVHLTFSQRAYALADWYRARGSKVILGGLHVISCPGEAAPHADALAIGDGVQLWPRIIADIERGTLQPIYRVMYENEYRADPAPRRALLKRPSFLTTTSLIATRDATIAAASAFSPRKACACRIACGTWSKWWRSFARMDNPTPSLWTTISGRVLNTCARSAARCGLWKESGAPRSPSM